ncbi:hypothetical protein B0T24DRAFT_329356 [Lasiosphaeria ovina]|uniref:Uncharacterized protein n=1 Tax=Lasiosphaeria ovina TaxID=92902 RepID=A0AAE0K7H7_9PEZI|nr:hypothetical protein B0T24DRAFT_329356 [Lasiosphaeria ovina]
MLTGHGLADTQLCETFQAWADTIHTSFTERPGLDMSSESTPSREVALQAPVPLSSSATSLQLSQASLDPGPMAQMHTIPGTALPTHFSPSQATYAPQPGSSREILPDNRSPNAASTGSQDLSSALTGGLDAASGGRKRPRVDTESAPVTGLSRLAPIVPGPYAAGTTLNHPSLGPAPAPWLYGPVTYTALFDQPPVNKIEEHFPGIIADRAKMRQSCQNGRFYSDIIRWYVYSDAHAEMDIDLGDIDVESCRQAAGQIRASLEHIHGMVKTEQVWKLRVVLPPKSGGPLLNALFEFPYTEEVLNLTTI